LLLVEDNPGDAGLIREMLAEAKGMSFELEWTETLSDGSSASCRVESMLFCSILHSRLHRSGNVAAIARSLAIGACRGGAKAV